MTDSTQAPKSIFSRLVLQGSPSEVGTFQAQLVKGIPGFVDFLRSGRGMPGAREIDRTLQQFQHYCPGLTEEMAVFCDALGIPAEEMIYYASTYLRPQHCGHAVALPAATRTGHVLVGRSYEFGESMDDKQLCLTRIAGRYAHLGFSTLLFGRNDGMNEHGLSVTTSAGGMPVGIAGGLRAPFQEGFQFWALTRTVLERCRTVEEAVERFLEFPFCGNPIFIFADPSGAAVLAEAFGPHKATRRIDGATEPYLLATNHFQLPETRALEPAAMQNSLIRHRTIRARLEQAAPEITVETFKGLLSTGYPEGLCCHYYPEFFGTLHSCVFDLNERRAEIALGSPAANGWHTMTLAEGLQPGIAEISLPSEPAGPEFWTPVPLEA